MSPRLVSPRPHRLLEAGGQPCRRTGAGARLERECGVQKEPAAAWAGSVVGIAAQGLLELRGQRWGSAGQRAGVVRNVQS